MGVVCGAWDPELERRVAIKLVRAVSRESRERMLREGQLLARFSHPNVVQIFDVGEISDQVFLVMEWVRGTTLQAYAKQSPGQRAIVDAYRQAGQGLAAAHQAGVVHRDFKPDNVIRGDDGRIRVLDFGLAHASDQESGVESRHAGTPRYMAPEQARGGDITAAADQFAFCVALGEAIGRGDTAANWIAAIVDRGTSVEIADRFPSMGELLAALDRDPARRRRRGAVVAAVAVVAIGSFVIGRSRTDSTPALQPCSGGPVELSASWNTAIRARMSAHLHTLGGPITDAEVEDTVRKLDDYAGAWVSEHRSRCESNERKEPTAQVYEAQVACLRRARTQLAAVVEVLDHARTAGDLAAGQRAMNGLPGVRSCQLASSVPPPPAGIAEQVKASSEHVERCWVRTMTRQPDALQDAQAAASEAHQTGYKPLIARALLVEGWAATMQDQSAALDLLDRAWKAALAASDDPLAVEAYARWVYAGVRLTDTATEAMPRSPSGLPANVLASARDRNDNTTALEMWPMMRELAERFGDEGRFAQALLYNNVATALMIANQKQTARGLLQTAWRSAGDNPPIELVAILENLARLEPDAAGCERQLRDALDRKQSALGPMHPDTLIARRNLAIAMRERSAARAVIDAACHGLRERGQTRDFQLCAYEAGWLADEDGDGSAARVWMASAAGLQEVRGQVATAYLAVENGAGNSELLAELDRFAQQPLTAWLDRQNAADGLVVLARAGKQPGAGRTGNDASADLAWRRALEMQETIDYVHFERRKARLLATMAQRWATSRPSEASVLATRALTWYRGVRGDEALVTRLEQIASASPH